jgi:hypothetical protein
MCRVFCSQSTAIAVACNKSLSLQVAFDPRWLVEPQWRGPLLNRQALKRPFLCYVMCAVANA